MVRPLTLRGHQGKSLRRSADTFAHLEPVSASAGGCGELGMIPDSQIEVFNSGLVENILEKLWPSLLVGNETWNLHPLS